MGDRHLQPAVLQRLDPHGLHQGRVQIEHLDAGVVQQLQAAAVGLDLDLVADHQLFQDLRLKINQYMLDAAVLAGDPAGLARCLARHHFGEVAGAGEEIERPVGAGLALELGEVADRHPGLDVVGEHAAGAVADSQIVGDAAHARVNVGHAVRVDPVGVDAAQGRCDLANHRLADQVFAVHPQHDFTSDVETEKHAVAVLHRIFLAFLAH